MIKKKHELIYSYDPQAHAIYIYLLKDWQELKEGLFSKSISLEAGRKNVDLSNLKQDITLHFNKDNKLCAVELIGDDIIPDYLKI